MNKLIINNVSGADLKTLESPSGEGIEYVYAGFSRISDVFEFINLLKVCGFTKNILIGNGYVLVNRTDAQLDRLEITEMPLNSIIERYIN